MTLISVYQVTPANAAKYTSSVQVGGARGQYITYTLDTSASKSIYFPLNFVEHEKGKADGVFDAELNNGDEFGVEASLTYNMDVYFAEVEASAGVTASVTQSVRKSYTHNKISRTKKSGFYIIEGTIPGKTTKTTLSVVNCSTGRVTTNKSDTYGFTPQTSAIIGFHTRDGVKWPGSTYADAMPYVIVCKAMGIK